LLTLLCSASLAPAADIVWTNTAGGNWGNPINWSPHFVPGPPDNAQITNAGTYEVSLDVDGIVSRLFLGGATGAQSLNEAGHQLTVRNASKVASNGIFQVQGGILDGAGDLLVEGKLDWESGTLQGTGRIILPEGRLYRIEGNGVKRLGRPLELRGGGVVADFGLYGRPGGAITVFPN
jgi:uncharacterized protein with beta-barrel porin domain